MTPFMPHGHCYLWLPKLVGLHVISDSLIFLAYTAIPFMLSYILLRRKDIPFNGIVICFGLFIVACGGTHLMDVITVWYPAYWVAGAVKAITAVASIGTAVLLYRLIPDLLKVPSRAEWNETTSELERKKIEQQFLANISHDLRTPISAVRGYSETLLAGGLEDPLNRKDFVEIIERNALRLEQMVDSLLSLATVDPEKVRAGAARVSLREFLENVLRDLGPAAGRAGMRLSNDVDPDLAVTADEQRLWQILQNLLSNAIKYVPPGGRVSVTARPWGPFVEVSVADDGPGLDPELLAKVFDRFHSPRSGKPNTKSAGLGLTIVRALVEAHGGKVWAENRSSGGAVFRFTLPAAGAAASVSA